MIKQVLDNKLLFIGLHIVLGFILTFLPIGKIFTMLFFVVGTLIIYMSRNENEEALYMASYLVGIEVFLRMTESTILYETGKYGVVFFIFLGFIFGRPKQKPNVSYVFYILLLLIGIIFTQVPEGESIRKNVAFNLSGPIMLGIVSLYMYKRPITIAQLKEILFLSLLPMFSMISFIYFRTPDLSELVFGAVSNYYTSGGFGPNQVATIIGFGAFILAVFLFIRESMSLYIFLDATFLIYFIYRGLLTFSRGGMVTAGAAFIAFAVFFLLYQKVTLVKISKYVFIILFLLTGIWLYTSNITGGMIDNRYTGRNSIGLKKKDVTAGRGKIFNAQLESFYEAPIFGIGVGNGKYKRIESGAQVTAASHNEVSRLIEEHGSIGIIALLILVITPLENFYFSNNYQRGFIIAFYIFWFLTISHSAMRVAFPGFVYALSLMTITDGDEEYE